MSGLELAGGSAPSSAVLGEATRLFRAFRGGPGGLRTHSRDAAHRPPVASPFATLRVTLSPMAKPHPKLEPSPNAERPRRSTALRALLLLVGLGLLGAFVYAADPKVIAENLAQIGWGFIWLLALSLLWRSLAATAMWLLLDEEHRLPWWKVMAIRWAGESLNTLMPFGNVGGEPVKALMLGRELGGAEATGYVLLDKTIFFLGSVTFMTTGALLGAVVLVDHPHVLALTAALLVPWIGALGWIVRRQMRGDFVVQASRLLRLVRVRLSPVMEAKLARVDGTVSRFWARRRGAFFGALALHLLARVLRTADVWLCVVLLGESISVVAAYFTAAAGMLVSTTFFFIPGALGASEGGHAFVFDLIGLGVAAGVTVGLVRRIRNYVLSGVGYAVLVAWPTGRAARK